MIPNQLRLILIISIIIYFIMILLFLKNKTLHLKYSLLWLFAGVVLGAMVIFPETVYRIFSIMGIISTTNGLFITCIAFVIMILMSLTAIISKQTDRIKNLTQTIARMEKRIRELESEKSPNKE